MRIALAVVLFACLCVLGFRLFRGDFQTDPIPLAEKRLALSALMSLCMVGASLVYPVADDDKLWPVCAALGVTGISLIAFMTSFFPKLDANQNWGPDYVIVLPFTIIVETIIKKQICL